MTRGLFLAALAGAGLLSPAGPWFFALYVVILFLFAIIYGSSGQWLQIALTVVIIIALFAATELFWAIPTIGISAAILLIAARSTPLNQPRETFRSRTTNQAGEVYIMRCPSHAEHVYKVGYTTKTAFQRANELSNTSAPEDFIVVKTFRVKDPHLIEQKTHNALNEFRVNTNREYFKAPLNELVKRIQPLV